MCRYAGVGMKALINFGLAACAVGMLVTASSAFSQSNPQGPMLDGAEVVGYKRAEVLSDFLNVAFSDSIWNEDTGEDFLMHLDYLLYTLKERSVGNEKELEKTAIEGWFTPYLFGNSGWPDQNVINKWTGPVTIAVGWPGNSGNYGSLSLEKEGEIVKLFEDHIQEIVPKLSEYTQLPVEMIRFGDVRDTTDSFAHIRVVPIRETHLRNFFKTLRRSIKDGIPHETTYLNTYENAMWTGVPFTPYARSQVDGYLVPDRSNNIAIVVCKIVSDLDSSLIHALISECLIRALGLPDLSKTNNKSLLSHWNSAHDKNSFLPSLDGRESSIWKNTIGFEKYMNSKGVSRPVFDSKITDRNLPLMPTAHDEVLVKILYCSSIKPGMNKYEVIKSFALDENCIGKILQEGK